MKTGISAVIAPSGEELRRSPGATPFVAKERVRALFIITPYVQFGNWVLWVAGDWLRSP